MAHEIREDASLPEPVRAGLAQSCEGLAEAFGDQLLSITLYGGVARGEHSGPSSDVNVLVVLKEVTVEALDRAAPIIQEGGITAWRCFSPVSETCTARRTSSRPSSSTFKSITGCWGSDLLEGLQISTDHLRLRCEQEIKNLLLRMRRFYVNRAHHTELIEATLASATSSFLASLGVLLRLKTRSAPVTRPEIAAASVRESGLDEGVLRDALALKSGDYRPEPGELKRLYGDFMCLVQQAADIVDEIE